MPKPVVAIIGRPNVGKSTLFNRLLGWREAIVADMPGTTRDRVFAEASWEDIPFLLVDTGGLEPFPTDPLRERVTAQVQMALEETDVIIWLLDALDGPTPMDQEIADLLRRRGKPVLVAVNKADNERRAQGWAEFYTLGMGDPLPISAYHNLGIADLMERVVALLPPWVEPEEPKEVLRLAIVGRTNVGKSLLLNAILGQERAIVSELPGTTRDALDTPFSYDGQRVTLIDTAGIRRRGHIQQGVERYSVLRAIRAVERADVALVVTDATELATAQDAHVAGLAWESYKGVVLVVNKWDLAPSIPLDKVACQGSIRQRLPFLSNAPVCFTSALQREGIQELLDTALALYRERQTQVPQAQVHQVVLQALAEHPPPSQRRRHLKLHRVFQGSVNPPTFVFLVNDARLLHFSYMRYLENRLRAALGFPHTHLRLVFKKGQGAK
ncbi:MAG: ribosome biogenesis GTPase Der [Dehalococcoidia bacterium]